MEKTSLMPAETEPSRLQDSGVGWYSDDEDSDLDANLLPPEPPAKSAARTAVFSDWIASEIETLSKERVKGQTEDLQSIEALLSRQDNVKITDPRDYQLELFERAKKENTIAVLDTGAGKTLIAVLLLRHVLDQEIEDRATGKARRYAFFLVNQTTLVFQQHSVLKCNLDHKIERVCGSMGAALWTKDTWEKLLKKAMVIVCTAEVLHQCLVHSYLTIEQINLLIFDEAHHAKQGHVYARIIRDFYAHEEKAKRPRVFGMTASPVSAKVDDLAGAARELEQLLDSRIATVTLSEEHRNKAKEHICYYDRGPLPFETPLWLSMFEKYGEMHELKKLFNHTKALTSTLGSWPSDFSWTLFLAEAAAKKIEGRLEKRNQNDKAAVQFTDDQLALLETATEYISTYEFETLEPKPEHLTPKVLELYHLLHDHFNSPTQGRCIVFVQTRMATRLLTEIFSRIGGQYLKVAALTGSNSAQEGDDSVTFRKQVQTLLSFRKGETNCLFATSVAEEGLDIPACNLVIRFDLYDSMIRYVQSKGRARHRNSKFYHMMETGNIQQERLVQGVLTDARRMHALCGDMPGDRIVTNGDEDLPKDFEDRHMEPSTKATLTSHIALAVLAHFVASLPKSDTFVIQNPRYDYRRDGDKFVYEVILPQGSPIERCFGEPKKRKSLAKRSAAFQMCKKLREESLIDENFVSCYQKILPMMRNAKLALPSKKGNTYEALMKPTAWTEGSGILPTEAYLTVIDIEGSLERPHQPLGILTRQPLPNFPKFPLFLTQGNVPFVACKSVQTAIPCSPSFLSKATKFSLVLLKDIFNKDYEEDVAKMPYWLVPVTFAPDYQVDSATLDLIATKKAEPRSAEHEYGWQRDTPDEAIADKYIIDIWQGGRRFFSIKVDPTKCSGDPVPEGAPPTKYMDSILEYSISLWKKQRELWAKVWDKKQPVLECEQPQTRRNLLGKPQRDEIKQLQGLQRVYVCPQPLKISVISTKIATMGYVFPAAIHRIEEYLISLEAFDLLGLRVDTNLALEAMTKDSDNSGDHQEEKINFRAGMGNNYERLEFIGDTFLKTATSISLHTQTPSDTEFFCHVNRMLMICNNNLFEAAKDLKLYRFVRSQEFSRRTWYPPCIRLLVGKGAGKVEPPREHHLGDKSVADVCEAIIGAAFVQFNRLDAWAPADWDAAVKAVTLLVRNENHQMMKWDDYFEAYKEPEFMTFPLRYTETDLAEKVYLEHPYKFNHPRHIRNAFNHPSLASHDKVPSYQRLEFLGDSLLDMVCVSYLFYNYPMKDPQWLTEHKMAMVSNKFLGALCVKIGFHRHLRHHHDALQGQIGDFVIEAEEAERVANGAVDYWTTLTAPPKCLPDIVESFIGALFVDAKFDFTPVRDFFDRHIQPFFVDMKIYDTFANNHPTTKLHHLLAIELGCRDFKLMAQELPQLNPLAVSKIVSGVMIHDKVAGSAVRESSGYAKVAASKKALELLEGMFRPEFRAMFGCDCVEEVVDSDGSTQGDAQKIDIGTAV
ncbi:hypothetical protein BT63DRAFT_177682 [Microthyrium microscopicum]|uniref:Dicer-like protein 1 n=1 Tax=Microthyrium microscopicum TaxID=703497 RepID=A0A6A6UHF1_9PEZI|nr:hypothetical protein BT63DRAFT_177682 [Microthyrium microscopicum]